MRAVSVKTYIRTSVKSFLPIEEASPDGIRDYDVGGGSSIGSMHYIPGAIKIEVYDAPLISLEMWTEVNYLWPEVIGAMVDCLSLGAGEARFPGQALSLHFVRIQKPDTVKLWMSTGAMEKLISPKMVAPTEQLLDALKSEAENYFREISRFTMESFGDSLDRLLELKIT